MDNQRLLVWATFGMLAWLTYQAWQADHAAPPATESPAPTEEGAAPAGAIESLPSLPDAAADSTQADAQTPSLDVELEPVPQADNGIVRVTTDVLDVEISAKGATLRRAVLRDYPVNKDEPDTLVELLSPAGSDRGQIQTGLIAEGDGAEPNHLALFSTPSTAYELDGGDEIVVPFTWTDGQGITVEKEIRFRRGFYRIDVMQRIVNRSDADWRGAEYAQIERRSQEVDRSMFNVDSYSFDGPIIYDGEKSEKLKRDDLLSDGPYDIKAGNGWVGSIQHHFLSAVVPSKDAEYRYKVTVNGDTSVASLIRSP
jgi:YidC/Oxa1 family membrane protein insertase